MKIPVAHGVASFGREKVVVNKGLGRFGGEFHHHSRGRVGVHVGVLAGDVVVFRLDDFQEDVAGLGTSGYAALVAIGDIAFGHFLARRFHEFQFHAVLNLFYGHLLLAGNADAVGDFLDQRLVFAERGLQHGLADGGLDFLFVVAHDATVAFFYGLYHLLVFWICLVSGGKRAVVVTQKMSLERLRRTDDYKGRNISFCCQKIRQ